MNSILTNIINAIKSSINPQKKVPPYYILIYRDKYMEPEAEFAPNIAYQKNYVVFDFETTGVDPFSCEIVEIGALKITDGEITEQFQSFVKPFYPISAEVTKINHITNEMVTDAPTAEEIFPSFIDFIGDSKLLGYNILKFDHIILRRYALAICDKFLENKITDVFLLIRKKLDLKKYTLSDVARSFKIKNPSAHRAIGDCVTTYECYKKLQEIYQAEIKEKRNKKRNEN